MSQEHRFKAVIEDAGNGGAFVSIPFDVEQVFGKKRVKVKALIAGEPYRGSLVRMGGACHILGIRKEIRLKTGKTFGDEIEIILEEDLEPRLINPPPDFAAALENEPAIMALFKQLSFTRQKKMVEWIEEAKHAATRQNRITQSLQTLKEAQK